MPRSETAQRVGVAAVGIPIAVGIVYLGGWALAALLAAVATVASLELFRMGAHKQVRGMTVLGAAASAGLILAAATQPAAGLENAAVGWVLVLVVLASLVTAIWSRGVAGNPLLASAVTVFAAVYVGLLLCFGLFLRHLPGIDTPLHGTALVFAPVLLTWASDTFAYFVGRRFGRKKLIPGVSPGKTVEGSLGALVGTVAVAMLYTLVLDDFPAYRLGLGEAAVLGVLVSVAAQVGDLAESLLKRDTGVKDSGTLLPGHGGALDRFDSLFFTLPLAYAFFSYVVRM